MSKYFCEPVFVIVVDAFYYFLLYVLVEVEKQREVVVFVAVADKCLEMALDIWKLVF